MKKLDWKIVSKIIFSLLFLVMLAIGILALLEGNSDNALSCITGEYWLMSTTGDMYITFFVFCIWIFHKERRLSSKIVWSLLVFLTGAISVCLYILIQLFRMKEKDSFEDLLMKRN